MKSEKITQRKLFNFLIILLFESIGTNDTIMIN